MNKLMSVFLLFVLMLFVACHNDKVAGGTEAESTIALQLELAVDRSSAAYARVRVLPEEFLSDGQETEWSHADSNGYIEIPVEPGAYRLEARHVVDGSATGAVYSFAMDSRSSKVDTVKLGQLSSIEGFVLLGDTVSKIRLLGVDRYVVPDSTGHFVIDSLPEGSYSVLFGESQNVESNTVDATAGNTLYVYYDGSSVHAASPNETAKSEYPEGDWSAHVSLLKNIDGYAEGTLGAAGVTDSSGKINKADGEICLVTTTDDFVKTVDAETADTTTIVAPGSFRECAEKTGAVWILFENDGVYNLQSPLRIKSDKTVDGRGRDVRIAGMGILTNESSNLIFENLTFTSPAITVQDTTSRRALSIHNLTHHVWIDHCKFESYPLVELDIKRSSHHVTVSWSRFENAQSGILFGLAPDLFKEQNQTVTLHHNYFANMDYSAVMAHRGEIHAYNNLFKNVEHYGIECTDSARCLIEKNIFDIENTVLLYREFVDDVPVDSTLGFAAFDENLFTVHSGEFEDSSVADFTPEYKYSAEQADADLALEIKNNSGPR